MTETEATRILASQEADLPLSTLVFNSCADYTTFTAEHAEDGDDLVFHFYSPTPLGAGPERYWLEVFPEALSRVAQEVFGEGYPRLRAAYTEEKGSWWMRAAGFVSVGLPAERVRKFYLELDRALDTAGRGV